ncbi:MAG: EamA family transporter [Alphaproteobacteria bacterium]|nr:EamA family transporter [Alphaproteobacteria bacterium]
MSKTLSTLIGFIAILTWAILALLSTIAGPIPPLQLAAMTFLLGGLVGAVTWPFRPGALASLRQPWQVWAVGVGGLCIYHCAYFFAIQNAPPVEVSLIAYLWPLLLVVLAAFTPGERLHAHHVLGVVLGLMGAIIVITKGGTVGLSGGLKLGHLVAAFCALVWASYSVLSRRFKQVPVDVVAGYCLATAAITFVLHLTLESTVWPQASAQWLAIAGLGLLPVGLAFYVWDWGCKHGDIMVLGALSYASPVLSVIALLSASLTHFHWSVALACALIVAGALVASKDMLFKKQPA